MKATIMLAVCTLVLVIGSATTQGAELILDGDFEGQLAVDGIPAAAPWTTFTQLGSSQQNFYIDTPGTSTPISSRPTVATPANGQRYAVTDQTGAGATALLQTFTVPAGTTALNLSFDLFVNDSDGGPIVDASGLDHTSNGTGAPNQHARVDILTATSAPLSTAAADVVFNVVPPFVDPQATNPNSFTSYDMSLPLLAPGTYQLRFAEVDNRNYFNLGVDNVSLTAIPEPATLLTAALGLAGLVCAYRRGRK
ncbi:PEP-CTERM sorting domain-containing protein [Aeoliella sp.]|uniref:PEP-CTERM sorting domain-containing protein n=1 Tax=Aeoliella sp. TaxID=2795800 RepID=UPI003CCBAA5D